MNSKEEINMSYVLSEKGKERVRRAAALMDDWGGAKKDHEEAAIFKDVVNKINNVEKIAQEIEKYGDCSIEWSTNNRKVGCCYRLTLNQDFFADTDILCVHSSRKLIDESYCVHIPEGVKASSLALQEIKEELIKFVEKNPTGDINLSWNADNHQYILKYPDGNTFTCEYA